MLKTLTGNQGNRELYLEKHEATLATTSLLAYPGETVIEVIITDDPDTEWDEELHGENDKDLEVYQTEVKATTIRDGIFIEGNAYLGGSWADSPDALLADNINGYLPDLISEALRELRGNLARHQIKKEKGDA